MDARRVFTNPLLFALLLFTLLLLVLLSLVLLLLVLLLLLLCVCVCVRVCVCVYCFFNPVSHRRESSTPEWLTALSTSLRQHPLTLCYCCYFCYCRWCYRCFCYCCCFCHWCFCCWCYCFCLLVVMALSSMLFVSILSFVFSTDIWTILLLFLLLLLVVPYFSFELSTAAFLFITYF